jgi:hypothetical protein
MRDTHPTTPRWRFSRRTALKLLGVGLALVASFRTETKAEANVDHTDFDRAFREDATFTLRDGGEAVILVRRIAELVLTSGEVVVSDGIILLDATGLSRRVAPGRYPVVLSIARFPNTDQRVVCAKLELAPARAVRWEMATSANQDLASLKDDELFGYPVDSGTGCFMDADAARILDASRARWEEYFEAIMDAIERKVNYVDTWDWHDVTIDAATGANVVIFSSGFGDGYYASYWGFDAEDKVVALVTDFAIL